MPDYEQHDFPEANSKIIPSGYLFMEAKQGVPVRRCSSLPRVAHEPRQEHVRSRSVSPVRRGTQNVYTKDKQGRNHIKFPRTGTLHMFNRATRFWKSSTVNHANDLVAILQPAIESSGKKAVLLVTDNGSDWSPKSPKVFLNMGRIWRDLRLSVLVQTTYAAGHSSLNMIEHGWAPVSGNLVGVVLPNTVDDLETGNMTEEEKSALAFDRAIDILNSYFKDKKWDGFPIHSHNVPCNGGPVM